MHRAGLGKQRLSTVGPGGLTHLLQEDLSGSEHVRASEEDEDKVEVDREGTGQPVP